MPHLLIYSVTCQRTLTSFRQNNIDTGFKVIYNVAVAVGSGIFRQTLKSFVNEGKQYYNALL